MCKYRAGLEEFQNYTWGGTVLRVKEREREREKQVRMGQNRFSSKRYKQEASSEYNKRNSLRSGKNKARILV